LRLSGSLHQFLCYKYVCSLRKVHTGVYWANLRERAHLEYLDVDGEDNNTEINFKQSMVGAYTGFGLADDGGQKARCCECGDELLDSIQCGEFPD